MASADILRAALSKIEPPEHFTQGVLARNAAGLECDPDSRDAVCWCALGALYTQGDYEEVLAEDMALSKASFDIFLLAPDDVNDRHGHGAVLQIYRAAIAAAEAEAGR